MSYLEGFKQEVSKHRLETFRAHTTTQQWRDAVDVYIWHTSVSSELLAPLAFFEVALRNRINDALIHRYKVMRQKHSTTASPWPVEWIELHGDWLWLSEEGKGQLRLAVRKVLEPRIKANIKGFNVQSQHVLPMMKFYFWEDMLHDKNFERLWIYHFYLAFPEAQYGPKVDERALLYRAYEITRLAREVRNRIAHHEPIFRFDIEQLLDNIESMMMAMGAASLPVVRGLINSAKLKLRATPQNFLP